MAAPIATATPSAGPAPAGTPSAPRADELAQKFLSALTAALQPGDTQGTNMAPPGPLPNTATPGGTVVPAPAQVEPDVASASVMTKPGARPMAGKTSAGQRAPDADVATIVAPAVPPPVPPAAIGTPSQPDDAATLAQGPAPETRGGASVQSAAAVRPAGMAADAAPATRLADPPPASATPLPPAGDPLPVATPAPPAAAPVLLPTGMPAVLAGQPASLGPAAQAGAAFVVLTRQPGEAQSLTLHLQPPDLGRLLINIEQPKNSGTRISLTAEQPETLLMLMRDQPAMHKALDSAGIAAEGRTLSFHLAGAQGIAPAAPAGAAPDSGTSLSDGASSQGGGAQTGMGDPGGRNQHGGQPRQTATGFGVPADPSTGFSFPSPQSSTRSQPCSAVDITA